MRSRKFCKKEARIMKNVFHRQLYIEGLKKVMIPGIISAIIVLSRSVLPPIVDILFDNFHSNSYIRTYADFSSEVSWLWVLTPCLIYSMFSFLNKRKQADFYHALPVKRSTMLTTMLASMYTWVWGILIVSVGLSAILWWISGEAIISFSSILLTIGMYMIATLYVGGFVILAMSISGTKFSNLTVAYLLMFSFRILSLIFYAALSTEAPGVDFSYGVMAFFDVKYWFPAALAMSMSSTTNLLDPFLWILTGTVMIACYSLAYVAFVKRKSQFAGQAAPERWLRRLYSTLVAMPLMFVGFILWFFVGDGLSVSFILFVLTIIIYFIYELISSKKLREAFSSLKFLCIPVVCCLCLVGAIYGIAKVANNTHYTADEMSSVRLYNFFDNEYNYWDENGNSFESLNMSNISVDDYEARKIVSEAWQATLTDRYNYAQEYTYQSVEIKLPSGKKLGREIRFTTAQYEKLQDVIVHSDECIDRYIKLPSTNDILIYKDIFTDEAGYPYLKKMWNAFVKEYNALSTEEKIRFKQQYSNQMGWDKEDAAVHLYVSGVTDRQESFHADYVIPESFVETRRLYMKANAFRTERFLTQLRKISDMSKEQFEKNYSYYSIKGNVLINEQNNSFAFGISSNDITIGNSYRIDYANLKDFLELILPYATTSFTDDACIMVSVTQHNTSPYSSSTTHKYVFGLKDMTDAEQADFLGQLKKYLTNASA